MSSSAIIRMTRNSLDPDPVIKLKVCEKDNPSVCIRAKATFAGPNYLSKYVRDEKFTGLKGKKTYIASGISLALDNQ